MFARGYWFNHTIDQTEPVTLKVSVTQEFFFTIDQTELTLKVFNSGFTDSCAHPTRIGIILSEKYRSLITSFTMVT